MSKEQVHFKFNIGSLAVSVEGGGGYGAPRMNDYVAMSVRMLNENGRPGKRESVNHYVKRQEIAAIGMAFLDVARKMAPETTWARSETVASYRTQQRAVIPLTAAEKDGIDKFLAECGEHILRDPAASFDKLRKRIATLQRVQFLLERLDDNGAEQLDILTTIMEHTGALPMKLGLAVVPLDGLAGEEMPPGAATPHQTH